MNKQTTQLPAELQTTGVSPEKLSEVQSVLNHVFDGVSKMKQQLESVVVKDEHDKVNMKLANTIRLGVRQVRLDAEKTFDMKRSEVQAKMSEYKTEDQLWLKAKQTMQILTKEIEENAKFKEETALRILAQRKELLILERLQKCHVFNQNIIRAEIEHLSNETFELFLSGVEKQYNDRIEAEKKAEEERLENLRKEEERRNRFEIRNKELAPYWASMKSFPNSSTFNYTDATDEEYKEFLNSAIKDKSEFEAKQDQIRIENEKLKAESEAKEKQLAEERSKAEQERKIIEEKARKEIEEANRKAEEIQQMLQAQQKNISTSDHSLLPLSDSENILALKNKISVFAEKEIPVVVTESALKITSNVQILLRKIVAYIEQNESTL